jgi:hypothetical protein
MTKAQKKIVFNWCVVVALIIIFLIFDDCISNNWGPLKWLAFAALFFVGAYSKNKPTRAGAHLEFNRIIDEHPWIKIYFVVYGITIAIGDYYIMTNHIDLIEHVSFFNLSGAILLLFLPIFILKQKAAWYEEEL